MDALSRVEENYNTYELNRTIRAKIKQILFKNFRSPAKALFLYRMIKSQKEAARNRQKWKEQEVNIPTFMAISITNHCNLTCYGCYARAQYRQLDEELSIEQIKNIISEAKEIGISFILLLGGEPLLRPEILDITQKFPDIIFPLLTNGQLLDEVTIKRLKKQRNVFPIISLEGTKSETDNRRGQGVFDNVLNAFEMMKRHNLLFGTNITATSQNFEKILEEQFIKDLILKGCILIGYLDYIPVKVGTQDLGLTNIQKRRKNELIDSFRNKYQCIFVNLPADEAPIGGCLSGRAFVHISSEGHLEPCVFATISDVNIKEMTLFEALQSSLLSEIRTNGDKMKDTKRGCTYWKNRKTINSTIKNNEIYHSSKINSEATVKIKTKQNYRTERNTKGG